MSQHTVSSTQQQDQVGRSNGAQMRRQSADQKASQGASAFADLLQQAAESPEPEAVDTETRDTEKNPRDPAEKPDPSDWFALTQAYSGPRTAPANGTEADTTTAATGATGLATEVNTTAIDAEGADAALAPELSADAPAEATASAPRRAPGKTVSAAAQTLSTLGAPAIRGDATLATPAAASPTTGAALPPAATVALPQGWNPDAAARPGHRDAPVGEGVSGADTTAPLPAGLEKVLAARGADAGGLQTDVQAGQDSNPVERHAAAEEPMAPDTPAWGESWGDAMEDLGHQISYWLGRGVKQAQIQVETGLGRPLEVALSLDKGQAMLHFQTDNAAARSAIESGAADILKDALARDGIGLAGLSVGSQDRQGQPGSEPQANRRAWGSGNEPAGPRTDGAPAPVRHSNRVLDLYA